MKFYYDFFCMTIKKVFTYRFNSILKMINRLIFMLVQITIWEVVYGNDYTKLIKTDYGTISLDQMIHYTIVSHILYCIIQSNPINSINDKIYKGDIALYMIRPYSFFSYVFIEGLAASTVAFLMEGIPLALFGVIFYNMNILNITNFLLFTVSLTFGYVIYFLLCIICGTTAFWFEQSGPISTLLSGIIKVFSGVWIPLWFFDGFIANLADVLPFKLIYFYTIGIYIGHFSMNTIIQMFLLQLIWMFSLFIIAKVFWSFGKKKVMILGG